ncbi:class II glutamine amidotransferase [Micromonospora sp. STR1s_5]|nr:class II glutamine amidotransferase [Micromonospora sp. STR1s_5]
MTYLGLYALQHRGQESAGIAVSNGESIWVDRGMGLVPSVFDDHRLAALQGNIAIGHTRYSTTGASEWCNAQPVHRCVANVNFALAHNGNLVNTAELAVEADLVSGEIGSDSDLIAELLVREISAAKSDNDASLVFEDAFAAVLPHLRGAFSLVVCETNTLIGVRDPNGFRPLFLGRTRTGGFSPPRCRRWMWSAPRQCARSSQERWSSWTVAACAAAARSHRRPSIRPCAHSSSSTSPVRTAS